MVDICVSLLNTFELTLKNKAVLWKENKNNRRSSFPFWSHPFTPFLGGLLLNWRVCRCLNLGGPLRGVVGPWFEAGGTKVALSLMLMVLGWLMGLLQAP